MDIYDRLGVKKIVNAIGTVTKLGGSLMDSSVFDAMAEAGKAFVDINDFHEKASAYIAKLLQVEAACITCGASAGIAISAAACIAGTCRANILQLPDTTGMKNEILMLKSHRIVYDQALQLSGAKIVEIGYTSFSCLEMVAKAITDRSAMFFYCAEAAEMRSSIPLEELIAVTRSAGIPMVVDAAAEIPPVAHITSFLQQGADAVIFSGGKEIRGPQSSGLILGNPSLIEACSLNCSPNHSIGRSMKVDKETIAGIVRAVEVFVQHDYDAQMGVWMEQVQRIHARCLEVKNIEGRVGFPTQPGIQPRDIPRFYFVVKGQNPKEIQEKLLSGEPSIHAGIEHGFVAINPQCLQEQEIEVVINAIRSLGHAD